LPSFHPGRAINHEVSNSSIQKSVLNTLYADEVKESSDIIVLCAPENARHAS